MNNSQHAAERHGQRDLVILQDDLQTLGNLIEHQRMSLAQSETPQAYLQSMEEMETLLPRLCSSVDQLGQKLQDQQRERGELAALFHVTQLVNSSLDLNQVLNQVMDQIIHLTQAERGFLMLYDDKGKLDFRIARNMDRKTIQGPSFDISRTIVDWVAEQGQPVVTTNAQEDARFRTKSVISYSLRSILCVPLCVKEQVTGVIYADNRVKAGLFVDRHRDLLAAFANQAAIALDNARLFAETQQRAEELAVALEYQKELDRLKSEFIRNTSHELRTPLAILRGNAELLQSGELGELELDQRKAVTTVTHHARMLTKLLENFETILAARAKKFDQKRVNLAEIVRSLLADFRVAAQKAKLTLTDFIASDLPPVSGDSIHLGQVLDNLLDNALKFTPAGGSITLHLAQRGSRVVLKVTDTGVGIPADQLGRIFERFYQVDGSTTRRYGGTGLGLAVVKEVVEAHGGRVTVQSTVGKGSTFRVSLPGMTAPTT